jgi:ribosomal protein S18 acetylase RimI-like enzyme
VRISSPALNQALLCEPILHALPDWFGIEDANRQFLIDIESLPTLIAWQEDRPVGFLTLKEHNSYSAEVHVMGVLIECHHQGIGTRLIAAAETYLHRRGIEYLQVKTLGPSHSDPYYARTRAFYAKVGFRPLQELVQIWDAENPCLIMIKRI